jgi:multidrug efflux pump
MILSELSVRRPVFATVLSLLLVILGIMALLRLPVREYPDISVPIVSIETRYRGAAADIVETKITQVIENRIAGIEGVDKLTSSSMEERSQITIEFTADRDIESATNDVRDAVARVAEDLPVEADPPEISKVDVNGDAVMYLNLASSTRSPLELSDYARRYLVDRFSVVEGVAMVRISGERLYAMRIWLDRTALAARQLTVQDVENALRAENVELPAGRIESLEREFSLRTNTGLRTPEDFGNLVVGRGTDGYLVRLGEVADVELAAEDLRSVSRSNAAPGISLGIIPTSTANILDVSRALRTQLDRVRAGLPEDMKLEINLDFSIFVLESMKEVLRALSIALALVLIVIYLFLGTVRATLIPAVTIPVSIVAASIVMALAGFSINVLTLLGGVLAIGLVVDDAIVVLENIVRRIEGGEAPLLASVDGSREIGFAVVATTLVLVAVFLPISYMPGNVGKLFGEFGITIAAAVAFSSLVALTLVPMMTSVLFAKNIERGRVAHLVDRFFRWLSATYSRALRTSLRIPALVAIVGLAIAAMAFSLFRTLPIEYAPNEDRAMLWVVITAPEGASLQYLDRYIRDVEKVLLEEVDNGNALRLLTRSGTWGGGGEVNRGRAFMPLALWDQRDESASEIVARLRARLFDLPGVRVVVGQPSGLGIRGQGQPVQLVLGGGEYAELARWRDIVIERAAQNPGLAMIDSDYHERKPQMEVSIDRDRAADLGVSLATVGRTLETMMGSRIVTTFLERGEEYNVILQARDRDRATPSDLANIYVRSSTSGRLIPLSSLVTISENAAPVELRRFDRLRSITISAELANGYSLGQALDFLENVVRTDLPPQAQINWDGVSREFKRTGGAVYVTFLLSLAITFLVLAAQFESFRHPVIIMVTVPLALAGALLGLKLEGGSINVFSQIGAIMLIGLAAKNGILIVEFANQLRDRGYEFIEAVIEASSIRLRPVLMTSLCTVFGAVPLLIASGAGAESRRAIGSVVVYGVTVSMFLTLFIVPAFFVLIARNSRSPAYVSTLIDRLRSARDRDGAKPSSAPQP